MNELDLRNELIKDFRRIFILNEPLVNHPEHGVIIRLEDLYQGKYAFYAMTF